jgi:hypothetical protein
MKKIITLFAILIATKSFAQTDSFEVKETKIAKAYNFLTMAKKEESRVWKINVLPFLVPQEFLDQRYVEYSNNSWSSSKRIISYNNILNSRPIIISFEKRLTPSFSICIESNFKITSYNTYEMHEHYELFDSIGKQFLRTTLSNPQYNNVTEINGILTGELRYYYKMKRRMHKHHLANNFSADYFSFKASRNIMSTSNNYYLAYNPLISLSSIIEDNTQRSFFDNNNICIVYGLQRRFLKYCFLDFQFGLKYKYSHFTNGDPFLFSNTLIPVNSSKINRFIPTANLRFGVAF